MHIMPVMLCLTRSHIGDDFLGLSITVTFTKNAVILRYISNKLIH
jgi:hypothetical protein